MSKRAKTDNLGAQRERDCIRARIRRVLRTGDYGSGERSLKELLDWINGRAKRFRARKGGL